MKNPAQAYRQFSVQGAPPLRLVVMLYDGVIAALQRAIDAIETRNIEAKCSQIKRALAIIAQLEGTLDFERGGEVATNLKRLYVYARTQITKANVGNSPEIFRSLIEKLATVREAWNQAEHARAQSSPTSKPSQSSPPHQLAPGRWRMSA
jgi:flagellar secretion chaperone FliS